MHHRNRTTLAVVLCSLGFGAFAYARTIWVPDDYPNIREAINHANPGDEVIVRDGVWTGPNNKNLDFSDGLPPGDTRAITVRSEYGPENCTIDCENEGRGFFFHTGEDPNSIVNGFTITNAYAPMGAGIYCLSSYPRVINCRFIQNHAASNGGGMRIENTPSQETLKIVNCAFVQNNADSWGGAVANSGSTVRLTNCTFTANTAGNAGGIANTNHSTVTITNSIVWGNTGQIWNEGGSNTTVNYSCIQGGWAGYGNIDCDPQFVDPDGPDDDPNTWDDNDYHLSPGSPCIDAGDNEAVPDGVTTDLDGNPRFVDDPCTDDTGNGEPPIVDMGAYEYSPDCNDNGIPDHEDLANCDGSPWCSDCNANGILDICDVDPNDPDCDGEFSEDCQPNGVPDDCEMREEFAAYSGELSPFDRDHLQTFTLVAPPPALSDVTLTFWAVADLDQDEEYVSVLVNGEWVCDVFVETGSLCPDEPDIDACTLGASTWNHLVGSGGGDAEITMQASGEVNDVCQPSYIALEVAYTARVNDCNDNGVLDACDILEGTSEDCQANGIPDECDINPDDPDRNGEVSQDCQPNGIPDECDIADCDPKDPDCQDCDGNDVPDFCDIRDCDPNDPDCQDCNGNGVPDWCDINYCDPNDPDCQDCQPNGVPDWCDIDDGTSDDVNCNGVPDECECVGDITGDGDTDHGDLGELLSHWGCCEGDSCYNPDADINCDGCINQSDLGILLGDWGCVMP